MANKEEEWGDLPSEPVAAAPPAGTSPKSEQWGDLPPDPDDKKSAPAADPGYGKALTYGIANAVPFAHDLGAAAQAAQTYLPHWAQTDDLGSADDQSGTFGDRFSKQKSRIDDTDRANQTYHPYISAVAPIAAGIGALPVAGPVDAVSATIGRSAPYVGGLARNALASGAVGSGYGAMFGAGTGNSVDERVQNAESGAGLGAVAGGAAPIVGKAVGALGSALWQKTFGSADTAALNRIRGAYEPGQGMSPADVQAASASGQPVVAADVLGGTKLYRLAREAANSSPDADSALNQVAQDRYQTQGSRLQAFLQNTFQSNLNPTDFAAANSAAAKAANAPNYAAAYKAGANGIWDSDLEGMMQSPQMQKAATDATTIAKNDAIINGNQVVQNPFVKDPTTGATVLAQGANGTKALPTLQYWDYVKRGLDDQISTAYNIGAKGEAGQLTALKSKLTGKLDAEVTEYAKARDTAFQYFKAGDAYEAGQNFLQIASAAKTSQMHAAYNALTPPQQDLFAKGLASQIAQTAQNTSNKRNIASLFDKPEIAQRLNMGLGQYAPQVETYLRTESVMDRLRTALGNSWTAKNTADLSGHGGPLTSILSQALGTPLAAGVVGAGEAARENGFDPIQMAKYGAMGAGAGFLAERGRKLNAATMQSVAEMLTSNDPQKIAKTVSAMGKNPAILGQLRMIDRSLPQIGRASAPGPADSSSQSLAPAYAKGGAVKRKSHEELVSRLMAASEQAKAATKRDTKSLLSVPDNSIAKALAVAQRAI